MQVLGISLGNGNLLAGLCVLPEYLNVVFHQFHGIHPIATLRKIMAVSSGGCANLQNSHTGAQILFNITQGGQIFHYSPAGIQAMILVIAPIVLCECL